jgi:hypothetical protein
MQFTLITQFESTIISIIRFQRMACGGVPIRRFWSPPEPFH